MKTKISAKLARQREEFDQDMRRLDEVVKGFDMELEEDLKSDRRPYGVYGYYVPPARNWFQKIMHWMPDWVLLAIGISMMACGMAMLITLILGHGK